MKSQGVPNKISAAQNPGGFPACVNKKQARMVCLNQKCNHHAFFCLQCEDQSCESMHRHEDKADKLVAISFKEFIRRVLKPRKPIEELQTAVSTYRQTLEKFKEDIIEFVEKELRSLDDVITRSKQPPEQLIPIIKKLREEQYEGLKGSEMDYLWKNCGDSQESLRLQHQASDFIRIKEEELKAISEHFQNLNRMDIDKLETIQSNSHRSTGEKVSPNQPNPVPPIKISKKNQT